MTAETLARSLDAKRVGSTLMGKCPAHEDGTASLSIRAEAGKTLIHCHAGCQQSDVIAALKTRGLWESGENGTSRGIDVTYDYVDENGRVLYQVVRKPGKKFMQRRPNGEPGGWQWGLGNVRPVPFQLPAVLAADSVFIVEGEKDALNLSRAGLTASCNNGGAGNFKPAIVPYFAGKHIVIIPDDDEPGRKHAEGVAGLLYPVAASVRVINLPDLPVKGDVSDYLAAGGTAADIRALCRATELWTPNSDRPAIAPPVNVMPPVITGAELYQGNVVTLPMLVDGLLWAGLTMLVARPKAGKSWLTLQLAVQIAGGPQMEGVTALKNGPVVYCALEEPASRTMSRLRKIAPAGDWASNLHFVYDLLPLLGGGAEQLAALIQNLSPRLLVIDTFTALVKTGSKSGSDVFRSQYAEVSRIRKLAEEFQTAVLVVHHTRKGISDGAIESVAGTGGIAAAVDTVWMLKRKPEGEAALEIVGRETEDRTLAMKFEQEPAFGWLILGDDEAQLLNGERRQVIELLREEGALTPAQIAAELAKGRPAVRQLLKRMRQDNQLVKQGTKYIPTHTMSHKVTE